MLPSSLCFLNALRLDYLAQRLLWCRVDVAGSWRFRVDYTGCYAACTCISPFEGIKSYAASEPHLWGCVRR